MKKLKEKGHLVPCPKGRADTGNGNELSLNVLIEPYGLSLLMDFFGVHGFLHGAGQFVHYFIKNLMYLLVCVPAVLFSSVLILPIFVQIR